MKKIWTVLLIAGALLPIIRWSQDGVSSLLVFSVFVLIFLWKGLQRTAVKLPITLPIYFIVLGTLAGVLTQLFVQLEGFEKTFSGNPLVHFFQALTIYFCVTIAWYLSLRKYKFTVLDVFWITGIWGVVVEGVFLYHTFNFLVWVVLFAVYGSVAAIPYVLVKEKFSGDRELPMWKSYATSFGLLVLALLAAKVLIYIMAMVGIK